MHIPSPEELLETVARHAGLTELLRRLSVSSPRPPRIAAVGGVVRDALIEQPSTDVDLVVEGPVERVLGLFDADARAHERFGTVTVELGGRRFDLAEARTERYARPGALPDVLPATVEQDLARRDFTVNAMAVELTGGRRGELLTHPGSLEDLEQRRLAILHDGSFLDDPTRLLRLARYRGRLGFAIAAHTRELATGAARGGALETVSGTRIGNELRLLSQEPDPVAALIAASELGLDSALDPDFGLGSVDGQAASVLRAALSALPDDARRDLLALAAAADRVPAERLRALLDRLAFTAGDRAVIEGAATGSRRLAAGFDRARRPSEVEAVAGGAPLEAIALQTALASSAGRRNAISWLTDLRHIHSEITGDDLIAAGLRPGPAVGAGLRAAHAALLDGEAPGRERQLQVALATARELHGA